MLFCVHCVDRPDAVEKRKALVETHRAYMAGDLPVEVVMSGPLLTDDGETMIGSLFLVEAAGRAEAEAFSRGDPFSREGVFDRVDIKPFWRRHG